MHLLTEVKKFMLERGYKPGDKIATEQELSTHFGVSRNKIREATTTLCQLGILEKKARRGTIVKDLDHETISSDLQFRFSMIDVNPADFQEARIVMEKAILPLAIKRITPILLDELEKAVNIMETNQDKPETFDNADREFHLILVKACGNQTLQAFGQLIQALFQKQYRKKYWTEERFRQAAIDHNELLDAIKSGDESTAFQLISNHFKYY